MTGRVLALDRPLIMGIVNVTPDSFSDGGRFLEPSAALDACAEADRRRRRHSRYRRRIDAARAQPRSPSPRKIDRVVPVLEALRTSGVVLSVDTSKPGVMRAALDAGAAIVNDVCALQAPGALDAVAASDCGVVLMHMQGSPRTMQVSPHYTDVVGEVRDFLRERIAAAHRAWCRCGADRRRSRLRLRQDRRAQFRAARTAGGAGHAWRADPRRRSRARRMLGAVTGRAVGDRTAASVAAAVIAVERGARIVRVHDVAATRDALRIWAATLKEQS